MTALGHAASFGVLDIAPEPYTVTPMLAARIGVAFSADEPVTAIALRAQVRIEPSRRTYSDAEAAGMLDLFGPRPRWSDTQRSFLWMHAATMIPGFTRLTQVTLPLACTYDFEVAADKYMHALRDGLVPLQFLFSGTIFTAGANGFTVHQISWDREHRYNMPVQVWRDLMAQHFPDSGWVRLHHDTVSALAQFKSARGLLDFDTAVTTLLESSP
ncbi:hypothetical protein BVC93_00635 [Mycobacterium sp. MS1601]|uniref:DUF6084 family protein n=1 Tax=Mycobacterium sp. MS1601 TaxID=1936029 RepID=UPI0009797B41|nr:DUF6084 family protein [Mycobacterium sp. MS1601]AQA01170.1 hypothetical protein BVC93_00635 [Mycobacterium sp. MS1601]